LRRTSHLSQRSFAQEGSSEWRENWVDAMPNDKAEALDAEDESRGITARVPCLTELDETRIRGHLASGDFFWLDLTSPTVEQVSRLGELFDLHPLALEDTLHPGQRPKLDDYGDHVFLVFYGAAGADARGVGPLCEVKMFLSGNFVITVHRDPLPALAEQRSQIEGRVIHSEQFVVYRILDALTDTFFPPLSAIDDEIDQLEDAIIREPSDEQMQAIFQLKRALVAMRKVITPQRDLLARGIDTIADIPGFTLDERDYFRDVYDHVIRISDLIDSYRDLLAGAMDAYLSTVANRQNEVMKHLTVVATIFLPLTFLTGFFGMNFAFMVNHVQNTLAGFLALAVGGSLVSVTGLWVYFRRKRWT
jgi:magnesium transporter